MHIEFTHTRSPAYWQSKSGPIARPTAGAPTALGAAASVLARFLAQWSDGHSRRPSEGMLRPRTWVLTDDLFVSYTDRTSTEYAWPSLTMLTTLDDAYLLRSPAGKIVDIPREPLTPEQDAELSAFLPDRGTRRS
ncbi:YcxB family protein [Actinoplanes sp. G11-F43]|uniref:YcxB family protein n=1 Tax=Actinoplanes sp. G11-F43 TaxID=3424130 RepID=UPI003D32631B